MYKFEDACRSAWIYADIRKIELIGADYFIDLIHQIIIDEFKNKRYQAYVTESLRNVSTILLRAFGDSKTEIPSYIDVDKPDESITEEKGKEILEHSIERFKEECARVQRKNKGGGQ